MKQLLILEAKTNICKMQNAKVSYLLNYEKFYKTDFYKIDWILYSFFSIIYNFKFLHIIICYNYLQVNAEIQKKSCMD